MSDTAEWDEAMEYADRPATEPRTQRDKAVDLIADSMRRRGFSEYADQHAEQIMAEAVAEAASGDAPHYEAGDYDALCANCGRLTTEHLCEAAQGAAPLCEWTEMGEPEKCGLPLPCSRHSTDAEGHPFGFTNLASEGAAPRAEGLDYEALRMERHWPTPDSMRRAADALDELVIPKYGDVLRWVADLCDESLTSRPSDERVPEGED